MNGQALLTALRIDMQQNTGVRSLHAHRMPLIIEQEGLFAGHVDRVEEDLEEAVADGEIDRVAFGG